jgi:hypothetical protein
LTWQHDPRSHAPRKYRRACRYEAYIPDFLSDLALSLDAELAGIVSEAEAAVQELNASARPALAPLARLVGDLEGEALGLGVHLGRGVHEVAPAAVARG